MHNLPRFRRLALAILCLAVACTLMGVPARAADLHFGYIDSSRIFLEYKVAVEAQARFDRQVQGWRDEAAEKEKSVTQLRQEVRDQAPILSALKRQEKEAALQRAIADYEQFIQDIWGPQGRAQSENEHATADLITQIRSAVEKVASEKAMEVVLDSSSGFLVYADKTLDLTTDVITELNSRTPGSSSTTH